MTALIWIYVAGIVLTWLAWLVFIANPVMKTQAERFAEVMLGFCVALVWPVSLVGLGTFRIIDFIDQYRVNRRRRR